MDMFNKSDRTLNIVRVIVNVCTIIGAASGVIAGIVLAALGLIAVGLPILFCVPLVCWFAWLGARLLLTLMADVKFIRNKLYGQDNGDLAAFLGGAKPAAEQTGSAQNAGYAEKMQRLMQLKKLLDDGTITEQEFESEKARPLKD